MITINSTSRELTKVEEYLMTSSPAIKVMNSLEDGTSLPVLAHLQFTDTKDNGDVVEILSVLTEGNVVYSCQSQTFKRSFLDIAEIMGDTPYAIIKTSGTTKAGRPFINCELDVTKLA